MVLSTAPCFFQETGAAELGSKKEQSSRITFTPQFSGSFSCPLSAGGKNTEGTHQDMLLQETPRGLAYQFNVDLTINPNRIRAGWQDGTARQVCDGVFTDTIIEQSDPQNGKPVVLTFISEPEGNIRVVVQGSIENNPYFSFSDFEGVYRRQRTKFEVFDQRFSEAIALCNKLEAGGNGVNRGEQRSVFGKAARLIDGGDALALAMCDAAATAGKAGELIRDIWCARQGDRHAMKSVFGWLGGGCGRVYIDPEYALSCYERGKKRNADFAVVFEGIGKTSHNDEPSLASISHEKASGTALMLEITKRALACGPLDVDAFFAEHKIRPADFALSRYAMWKLAEEASLGGRFGAPNQQLALKLMVRCNGELSDIAKAGALLETAWKTGNSAPVKVLALIKTPEESTPSTGAAKGSVDHTAYKAEVRLALKDESRSMFDSAFAASFEFSSALAKRVSSTRGMALWTQNSAAFLNHRVGEYLQTVNSIRSGFTPTQEMEFEYADYQLSLVYLEALLWLRFEKQNFQKDTADVDLFYFDSIERLKVVQRLWIKHRDASAKLFHTLNPRITEEGWRAWLTSIRTLELMSLLEQSGVHQDALDALRARKRSLEREYFGLYEEYQKIPSKAFTQGLVRSGISSPAIIGKKISEQLQRLTQEAIVRDNELDWRRHGAFAQIYQLRAWSSLLEQTVNFSEAVLRCNLEGVGSDPSGYYEDFEGGAVCLFRDGDRYAVLAGCVRPLMPTKVTLSFAGKLADDVINAEPSSGAKKRPTRLLVGRGMICLEPNSDGIQQVLANTYVRVGVLNDAGKNHVKSVGAYGAFEQSIAGDAPGGFSSTGLKRFSSRKYPADLNEAAAESRKLLGELLPQE